MSLIDRVQRDAQRIMNSERFGFSNSITLTEPNGTTHGLKGILQIIHNLIDPDTGQPVSGFLATVSLNALDLQAGSIDIPFGEMSTSARPWTVESVNVLGNTILTKVVRVAPDETNGNIVIDLGAYER